MSEYEYGDYVERLLKEEYGAENVERQVYLPETGRFVDFLIDCGLHTLAVELEHSSERVVYHGYGQALFYAKHNRRWAPAVIYPPDGENEAELSKVAEDVVLIPIQHKHE